MISLSEYVISNKLYLKLLNRSELIDMMKHKNLTISGVSKKEMIKQLSQNDDNNNWKNNLNKLKLPMLKKIAKLSKIKNYYKLNKQNLLEKLYNEIKLDENILNLINNNNISWSNINNYLYDDLRDIIFKYCGLFMYKFAFMIDRFENKDNDLKKIFLKIIFIGYNFIIAMDFNGRLLKFSLNERMGLYYLYSKYKYPREYVYDYEINSFIKINKYFYPKYYYLIPISKKKNNKYYYKMKNSIF
jgi:hypothetical protein